MLHRRPLSENLSGSSSAQGSLGDMSPGGCLHTHIVANLILDYNDYPAHHVAGPPMTPSLPPPPSYDSVHPDVTKGIINDVMHPAPTSSSSSDEFEEIIETDLESQWELDRMVGFTLEERVRREWYRRQAAVENAREPAPLVSQSRISRKTDSGGTDARKRSPVHPGFPPTDRIPLSRLSGKPSLAIPLPDQSRASLRVKELEDVSSLSLSLDLVTNSSQSSLEDWDILDQTPEPLGASERLLHGSPSSNDESFSSAPSSSQGVRRKDMFCVPLAVHASHDRERSDPVPCGGCSGRPKTALPSVEGKEQVTCQPKDDFRVFAIHNRPLPTPPCSSMLNRVSIETSAYH
jgi:hypothetical protein